MPTESQIFSQLAQANKFMTPTECEVLSGQLKRMRERGKQISFAELAVQEGKLTRNQADRLNHATHYNLIRLRDKKCARRLMDEKIITEEQFNRFAEEQSRRFREKRQAVSALNLMAEAGAVEKEAVEKAMRAVSAQESGKKDETVEETPVSAVPDVLKRGAFVLRYREDSVTEKILMSVVTASGQIDSYTTPLLKDMFEAIFNLAGDRGRCVVLDLTDVSYISSAGIGQILAFREVAQERGGDIKFVNLHPEVLKVFELIGLKDTLHIFKSVSEALWSFLKDR